MGARGSVWALVPVLLALLAGPAAALEHPRCRAGTACTFDGPAHETIVYYTLNHTQVEIEFIDSKRFSVTCYGLHADDPAMPAMPFAASVDEVHLDDCLLPNKSYAEVLAELNVTVTKKLRLTHLPAEPRLTRQHLAGLAVTRLELAAAEIHSVHPPRPEPDFLAELPRLRSLWLYSVVPPPRALLALPDSLIMLMLNDVRLPAAERGLSASPEPAVRGNATRWLVRLRSLRMLSLIEQGAAGEAEAAGTRLTPPPLAELRRLERATLRAPLQPLPARWLNGSALRTLVINTCGISDLTSLPFQGANLTILNISNNNLTDLPSGVFSTLEWLTELDLSGNELTLDAVERVVPPLKKLEVLRANGNPLGSLCGHSSFANGVVQSQLPRNLRHLELRGTRATRICSDWLDVPKLMHIDLSQNRIDSVDYGELTMLRRAREAGSSVELDLSGNDQLLVVSLMEENLNACRATAPPARADSDDKTRVKVELNLSTVECSCNNAWFRAALRDCPRLLALRTEPGCAAPPAGLPADRPTQFLAYEPDELLCSYEGTCIPGCWCGRRERDNATVVSCAGALPAAPRWPASRWGQPLALNASGAGLTAIPNATLVELYAADNNIAALRENDIPETLKVLDLRNNSVTRVSAAAARRLAGRTVWLAGNPLACACGDEADLGHLKDAKVRDWGELKCKSGRLVSGLRPGELCGIRDGALPLVAGVVGALLLLALATAAALRWGKPLLKRFLFKHQLCLNWVLGADDSLNDPEKTHDVFVSYAHQDHAVAAEIVRELERRGYSTVEHCRDWMPGAAVSEHIANSVRCARRTLLLVSDDYGASKWALEEFRIAHSHALERRTARLLIVRCGLRAPERLPLDLQLHLRFNTYLDRSDSGFWNKLCGAMPPLPAATAATPDPPLSVKKPQFVPSFSPAAPPNALAAPALLDEKKPRLWTPPAPAATVPPRVSTPPLADKLRGLLTPRASMAGQKRAYPSQIELAPRTAPAAQAC